MFSAVDTVFISPTIPALSTDASSALLRLLVMTFDSTTLIPLGLSPAFTPDSRSVLENCLLYSSLCCSLLAAVGAMLEKDWLPIFDRFGQAGPPLEQQGRSRQRKYNGVQQWHLETIILFLSNILLLSVPLFFQRSGVIPLLGQQSGRCSCNCMYGSWSHSLIRYLCCRCDVVTVLVSNGGVMGDTSSLAERDAI